MLAKALQSAAGNAAQATYIEDVFSTYLYTGNGSTQTITNGIDLAGEGGLVWIKDRVNPVRHMFFDTTRGATKYLSSNLTAAEGTQSDTLTTFGATGFSLGADAQTWVNGSAINYASWTFRKAPKFFDVVTYTGTGSVQNIAHSLGSTPGCIIVKSTTSAEDWAVYHTGLGLVAGSLNDYFLLLNTTNAKSTSSDIWGRTVPTSTQFTVGNHPATGNSGDTYVAYLFAHDAGGFGDDGSENVISCGSYTGNGSTTGPVVTLGYEPQFVMAKAASTTGDWFMVDTMRGQGVSGSTSAQLKANTSDAEVLSNFIAINSTGFQLTASVADKNGNGSTYIYIAIRRGPMKTPTTGTEVFSPTYGDNDGAAPAFITNFPVDLGILAKSVTGTTLNRWAPRLTQTLYLTSTSTAAEATGSAFMFDFQNGWVNATSDYTQAFSWNFRRAPGFFDVVCYTGNGSTNHDINHNLAVVPEMLIYKSRSDGTREWVVYHKDLNTEWASNDYYLKLNSSNGVAASNFWDDAPTATTFQASGDLSDNEINGSGQTYVAYLFATVAGVSKVGSYTGNGTSQTIDCGFTTGARFVLIKRTDSTGDWYVWDSARGIVAGNDPHLSLNTTAAEVTTDDSVDADTSGFVVNQDASTNVNVTSATYIFLSVS